jgi:hypothetical protein
MRITANQIKADHIPHKLVYEKFLCRFSLEKETFRIKAFKNMHQKV